jgi:DegV family protein with EDD domain
VSDRPASPAVRIVTDSACDLPADVAAAWGIHIVPLTIRIDGIDHIDRTQLTTAQFWAMCAASPELPTTAAPSPGQFEQVFRQVAAEGAEGIAVISLASR